MDSKKIRLRLHQLLPAVVALCVMACTHRPPAPAQLLFASLPDQHMVAIFPVTAGTGATPLATITEAQADIPIDVGIDLPGDIFIANQNANIKVYAGHNDSYQMIRSFSGDHTQMRRVEAFAVGQKGGLYVADAGAGSGDAKILIFAANMTGNIPPDHWIGGPHTGLVTPTGISIDAAGRIFVADHSSGKILIFEANTRGDTPPIATINVASPNRLLVDEDLNLYVDSGPSGSITTFIPEGTAQWSSAARITASELQNPQGMAVDASGRIAAAIQGGIAFFSPNTNGPATPVQLLQGPAPFNPAGIAIR